jgi:RND family efflux transporter MFP subunit
MLTRARVATTVVIAAVMLALSGCGSERTAVADPGDEELNKATPVAVARVTRQDLARQMEVAAEFRPWQEIDLHAKVSGYLRSIYVDVGDRVRQGQLIAVLEVPEMTQELAQASGSARRTALEVERARSDVARAEAAATIRRLSWERLAEVAKTRPNLIAQQELDDAHARYNEAQAQVSAARSALGAMEEQVNVANATKERVHTMMSYSRISAPFSGVITQRRGDPGALVQAGTASHTQALPLVRLSQVDRLRLVLPVPESIVPRIRAGDPVEIRVDSLGRVFQGKIARFTGRLDSTTRTMETEVDVPNDSGALKPGMYGYASLRLDQRQGALAVPVQAVKGRNSDASVLTIDGNRRLQERRFVAGIETPDLIEAVSGLREDEFVVVGNRGRLRAGMLVDPRMIDIAAGVRSH